MFSQNFSADSFAQKKPLRERREHMGFSIVMEPKNGCFGCTPWLRKPQQDLIGYDLQTPLNQATVGSPHLQSHVFNVASRDITGETTMTVRCSLLPDSRNLIERWLCQVERSKHRAEESKPFEQEESSSDSITDSSSSNSSTSTMA